MTDYHLLFPFSCLCFFYVSFEGHGYMGYYMGGRVSDLV